MVFSVACALFVSGTCQARSQVSLPTANSIEEAFKLMDTFEGQPEDFRVGIPEQLFDAAGVNESTIIKHALSKRWGADGYFRVLSFRVYRFKAIDSQPNKLLQPIAPTSGAPAEQQR
jgi:hypothetical protein